MDADDVPTVSVAIFADLSETGRFFTLAADKKFEFQMQIFGSKMAKIGRFLVMLKISQEMTDF